MPIGPGFKIRACPSGGTSLETRGQDIALPFAPAKWRSRARTRGPVRYIARMTEAGQRRSVCGAVLLTASSTFAGCSEDGARTITSASQQPASTHHGMLESREARLSYQLDLPARRGDVPAVVIGHGSGRVAKEHCRSLASGFLERGFATLCYDKRGVGHSSGEYASVGPRNADRMFDLLAEDMAAGVRFLRSQHGIDVTRVGLAGVSQAGWIIPLAATRTRPAFMIILSGPTVVGEEIFYSDVVELITLGVTWKAFCSRGLPRRRPRSRGSADLGRDQSVDRADRRVVTRFLPASRRAASRRAT
jgi:pimeloyl-ACP methyl ester carboxylesterase